MGRKGHDVSLHEEAVFGKCIERHRGVCGICLSVCSDKTEMQKGICADEQAGGAVELSSIQRQRAKTGTGTSIDGRTKEEICHTDGTEREQEPPGGKGRKGSIRLCEGYQDGSVDVWEGQTRPAAGTTRKGGHDGTADLGV